MQRWIDIKGQQFGFWTVLRFAGTGRFQTASWLCRCRCGARKIVQGNALRSGTSTSCGCSRRKPISHGDCTRGSPFLRLYKVWTSMKRRTRGKVKPSSRAYACYRHVTLCTKWLKYEPFKAWALANGYRQGLFLDRIDSRKGYTPSNCRWVTPAESSAHIRWTPKRLLASRRAQALAAKALSKKVLCLDTGEVFPSIAAAVRKYGSEKTNLRRAIRTGIRLAGMRWEDAA